MRQTYAVRQCSDKGWLIESLITGNKLMFYSTREKALSRCQQLIELAKESPSRSPGVRGVPTAA